MEETPYLCNNKGIGIKPSARKPSKLVAHRGFNLEYIWLAKRGKPAPAKDRKMVWMANADAATGRYASVEVFIVLLPSRLGSLRTNRIINEANLPVESAEMNNAPKTFEAHTNIIKKPMPMKRPESIYVFQNEYGLYEFAKSGIYGNPICNWRKRCPTVEWHINF